MSHHYVIHIVRHGETASYGHDAGLTEVGHGQAAARGRQLGRACKPGESVEFAYAPTERARETVIDLRAAFAEASQGLDPAPVLGEVAKDRGFSNLQVLVDGEELEPTAARSQLLPESADGSPLPGWMTEAHRFWASHQDGGDVMQFWLRTPLLWHESPSSVIARLIHASARRAASAEGDGHLVVASHAGCIRALVGWASGSDPGEPENGEEVLVVADPEEDLVTITYCDEVWTTRIPLQAWSGRQT